MSRLRERTLLWCSWGRRCMGTLSGVALCSRGVDLLIFGISAAVSMQAAATLRNPERLIPALPPQRTHSAGGDGVITERESTPLDGARPPSEIMEIVRETLQSYGLPEDKVALQTPTCFALDRVSLLRPLNILPAGSRALASESGENCLSRRHRFQVSWIDRHSQWRSRGDPGCVVGGHWRRRHPAVAAAAEGD